MLGQQTAGGDSGEYNASPAGAWAVGWIFRTAVMIGVSTTYASHGSLTLARLHCSCASYGKIDL